MIYWADQGLSAALILLCWWLAHQNATEHRHLGRAVAVAFAVFGMLLLANMLFRSFERFEHLLPWSRIASKLALAAVFVLKGWRMSHLSNAVRAAP